MVLDLAAKVRDFSRCEICGDMAKNDESGGLELLDMNNPRYGIG